MRAVGPPESAGQSPHRPDPRLARQDGCSPPLEPHPSALALNVHREGPWWPGVGGKLKHKGADGAELTQSDSPLEGPGCVNPSSQEECPSG